MSRYLLRRILILLPVLAGISIVLFTILALAPGDPFEELATNPNVPPEVRMNLRAKFGLDDPLPTFFTGLLFILLLSIHLDWLPFIYRSDISATGWRWYWEHVRQAIMPVAVLGLAQAASMTRFMRAAVLDVIRLDYVNTARAKGLSEGITLVKHVVRNALIPVVTLVAIQIPTIFGGAIVTEQIFRVPGIGSLLITSILANDTPVVMAVTFIFSILVLASSLAADMLYAWLHPRSLYPL